MDKNSKLTTSKIKNIEYKDLCTLNKWQVAYNVLLPYPFLVMSWVSAEFSYYPIALLFSYFFFASSFRQAHDGFHLTLGINKKMTDIVLYISSFLLIMSNHATLSTHLAHHKAPMSESDIETKFAQKKWCIALLGGSSFWLLSQIHGYKISTARNRKKIKGDYLLAMLMLLIILVSQQTFLLYHLVTMLVGHSLVGFLAGWCVHHGCDDEVIARTERNKFINFVTFNLFYHHEHHLFPRVPSNHLPELASRMDTVAPELSLLRVIPYKQTVSTEIYGNV